MLGASGIQVKPNGGYYAWRGKRYTPVPTWARMNPDWRERHRREQHRRKNTGKAAAFLPEVVSEWMYLTVVHSYLDIDTRWFRNIRSSREDTKEQQPR
jgi:hypothetical protein